jgi:uncharacterized membrane protein HdeD (DUF308 family)
MNHTKADKYLLKAFSILHLLAGINMILSGLTWSFFIFKGYLRVDHLPVYGDPEVVSFNGLDRQLVNYALITAFIAFCIWGFLTLISIVSDLKIISRTSVTSGLIGIAICFVVFRGPQFEWLLD